MPPFGFEVRRLVHRPFVAASFARRRPNGYRVLRKRKPVPNFDRSSANRPTCSLTELLIDLKLSYFAISKINFSLEPAVSRPIELAF